MGLMTGYWICLPGLLLFPGPSMSKRILKAYSNRGGSIPKSNIAVLESSPDTSVTQAPTLRPFAKLAGGLTASTSVEINMLDIAGIVAAMTEGDPGVESEKASHNTPG